MYIFSILLYLMRSFFKLIQTSFIYSFSFFILVVSFSLIFFILKFIFIYKHIDSLLWWQALIGLIYIEIKKYVCVCNNI